MLSAVGSDIYSSHPQPPPKPRVEIILIVAFPSRTNRCNLMLTSCKAFSSKSVGSKPLTSFSWYAFTCYNSYLERRGRERYISSSDLGKNPKRTSLQREGAEKLWRVHLFHSLRNLVQSPFQLWDPCPFSLLSWAASCPV